MLWLHFSNDYEIEYFIAQAFLALVLSSQPFIMAFSISYCVRSLHSAALFHATYSRRVDGPLAHNIATPCRVRASSVFWFILFLSLQGAFSFIICSRCQSILLHKRFIGVCAWKLRSHIWYFIFLFTFRFFTIIKFTFALWFSFRLDSIFASRVFRAVGVYAANTHNLFYGFPFHYIEFHLFDIQISSKIKNAISRRYLIYSQNTMYILKYCVLKFHELKRFIVYLLLPMCRSLSCQFPCTFIILSLISAAGSAPIWKWRLPHSTEMRLMTQLTHYTLEASRILLSLISKQFH